ncbi:MAG: extracellular solute-binding protein [Microbacteriaceae bacterium]|nr:extracellular solute-binding protein [Microbacteriaceae bacterium]
MPFTSAARSQSLSRRAVLLGASSLAATASLALAGCTPSTSSTGSPSSKGKVSLTFFNQSRGQEATLNALAETYTKQTGVKITVDTPGPVDYLPKLQALAQSKQMPDIYSSFTATAMAPFYKAGWAKDLSSDLKGSWGKNFSPAVVKLATFAKGNNLGVKPGIYTVHWETQTYGILADPTASGIDPTALPQTSTDLISTLAAARKNGQGNFTVAASLTPQFIQYLASNWLTDQQISDTMAGKAKWNADGWRNAFQFLLDLKKAGVLANNVIPGGSNDNPTVETDFFTKHSVAAYFDASPGVSVAHATAPDYTSFISLALPQAPGASLSPRSPGVPGKGAVINPRGQHPQEALAFVKWLTQPAQQQVFSEQAHIIPTNPTLLASGKLPTQLTGFASGVKNMQVLTNSFTSQVNDAITRDSQSLVLGEKTIDQVLSDIQSAQNLSA